MKPNSFVLLIFLCFLLLSSASARLLPPKQDEKEAKDSLTGEKDNVSNLMGLEEYECEEGDEECLKRRMVADAHLDYIYTQHHKKP
ncbi:hypothetical protein P3X46_004158 [Hevea brasiliensis]|uniref:Phytosulfokine n=1 Tax=Hevea brasiliensis TaxID=3981 RepID=A0ABQ9MYF9_HEVBR|nr:putative phytosulfokines 6 [Hevea brasiliensis]KAJ9184430.1 hypothetical protein P3X46_004158 [Hevea brasiliensis]